MRIVSVSDLGAGYPTERFIFDELSLNAANIISFKLNNNMCMKGSPPLFKVVQSNYTLNQ